MRPPNPLAIGNRTWRRAVGDNLRAARLLAGLSARAAARQLRMHHMSIYHIERGWVGPTLATFARLCALYRARPGDCLMVED